MKLKNRVKTYSFWVSLASAIILIVKLIGQKYGLNIDETFISDLVTTICGLLVILGIIVVPKSDINLNEDTNNNLKNTNISSNEDPNNLALHDETAESAELLDDVSQVDTIISDECQENHLIDNGTADNKATIAQTEIEQIESSQNNPIIQIENYETDFEQIKKHINDLLSKEKENHSNTFKTYKQILLEELNKIDD